VITVDLIKLFLSKKNYIKNNIILANNTFYVSNKCDVEHSRSENELGIWEDSKFKDRYLKLNMYNSHRYLKDSYFIQFIEKFKDNLELFDVLEKECIR
jgi:hypothetical protein